MKPNTLSKCLKASTIFMGICGIFFDFYCLPLIGKFLVSGDPKLDSYYLPWLFLILFVSIPYYIILVFAWRLFCYIGKHQYFTFQNAIILKWISSLALGDVLFFFFMNIVYLFLNINHPSVVLLSLLIAILGFCFFIAATALSHLTFKAAKLQEFSDSAI